MEESVSSETSANRQAVGVYVDVRPARDLEEPDEQLLDRLADTLEAAEQALRKAGLMVPLHTGTTLLAALVLPDDPRAALEERQRVVDQAVSLAQQLGSDPGGDGPGAAALRVDVSLHVDSAEVRGAPAAPDIAGPI